MRRFRKVHLMVVPVTLAAALPAMTVELATDIIPGFGSSLPEELTKVGKDLFFNARDVTNGRELWKTD